jgi:general stress protein 26
MTAPASERSRIGALIRQATVGMLLNIDEHGGQMGRPMLPLFLENDPHIYFLTHQHSRKVIHLTARPQVALTFISGNCYLVIVGSASTSRDPGLVRRLWNPTYRAWFPGGTDDREAIVLRVTVERVDYWEPPRSRLLRLAQAVKAIVTRRAADTPMKTIDGL